MPTIASAATAMPTRRRTQHGVTRSDFIAEAGGIGAPNANSKLIEQDPYSTVNAHFHHVNQFQVVVAGSGKIGRAEARPLTIHYAGAHTPYGPIVAGQEGIQYVVLRDEVDAGAAWMPESSRQMRKGERRYLIADPFPSLPADALARLEDIEVHDILPLEADGLCARLHRLPAGSRMETPDASGGGGQFLLLTGGEVMCAGQVLAANSCVHVASGEPPVSVCAGAGGAELLHVQFPKRRQH